jgi:glycosyltransferase involved in cell wall biosynthesis
MNKKLSIIIPVYNASLYVEKCLRSCAEQDIYPEEYEIIVINDGSKDNSPEIIARVMADYSNFVFIDKQNSGVSSARNAGLDIAKGKYIWFVDADDWIETKCLAFLLEALKKNDLDALQINAKEVAANGDVSPFYLKHQRNSPILSPEIYLDRGYFEGYTHMTLFRRNILEVHKIRFNHDIRMREDLLFYLELISNLERIQRLNIAPYYYYQRENSESALHDLDSNIPLLNGIRNIKKQNIIGAYNEWLIPDYLYDHIDQNIFNISRLSKELKLNGYHPVAFSNKSKLKVKIFFTFYNFNLNMALYFFFIIKSTRKQFTKIILNESKKNN